MDTKQKFVRISSSVIIFPCLLEHSTFKHLNPESAGFCYVNADKQSVNCFGESYSLRMKANEKEDSLAATLQIFGFEAWMNLFSDKKTE